MKLEKLLGKRFGASSEKAYPGELQLLLEGFEEAAEPPAQEKPAAPVREKRTRKKKMGFPETLKEETVEIDLPPEERVCSETGRERRLIRWEEPERSGDRLPERQPAGRVQRVKTDAS